MYQVGKRHRNRKILYGVLTIVLMFVVAALLLFAQNYFQADTKLNQAAPIVKTVGDNAPSMNHFDQKDFSIDLPHGWQLTSKQTSPYQIYTWQGTTRSDDARKLEIYVDTIPETLALNRMLPVQAAGGKVVIAGSVSDNCSNFTGNGGERHSENVRAKWNGVYFWCDLQNYERNVVGTGSSDGFNRVVLKGQQTGERQFFFVYTDHTAEPDYGVFTEALESFVLN
jgi:hypothetical protein